MKYGTIKVLKWEEKTRFNEDIYEVRRENLPSFTTFKDFRQKVTYQGKPRRCSKCDDPSHETRNCSAKLSYTNSVRKHLRMRL